jgi:hypothetical protein
VASGLLTTLNVPGRFVRKASDDLVHHTRMPSSSRARLAVRERLILSYLKKGEWK